MKLIIINGPNLNLLGKREPEIYGRNTFEEFFEYLQEKYAAITLHYFQNNSEGALIDKLHEVGFNYTGIIMNAGAYTHTSVAIGDAIAAITTPVIEVHISNIHARETFRHQSFTARSAEGAIMGLGLKGYALAIRYFME